MPLGETNTSVASINAKWATPAMLDKVYELVGRDVEIQPNDVGNLIFHHAGKGAASIGYLDLATDEFVWWDDDKETVYVG